MPTAIDTHRETVAAVLQLNERLTRLLMVLEHAGALTPTQVAHVTGECRPPCTLCQKPTG